MTSPFAVILPVALLSTQFAALSLLIIWGHQFLYKKGLRAVSPVELHIVVPGLLPVILAVWWGAALYQHMLSDDYTVVRPWIWWMPIAAVLIFCIGRRFSHWNVARLAKSARSTS